MKKTWQWLMVSLLFVIGLPIGVVCAQEGQYVTSGSFETGHGGNVFAINVSPYHQVVSIQASIEEILEGEENSTINPLIGYGSRSKVNSTIFVNASYLPAWITGSTGDLSENRAYLTKDLYDQVWQPVFGLLKQHLIDHPDQPLELCLLMDYMGSEDMAPARLALGFRKILPDGRYDYLQGIDLPSNQVEAYELGKNGWTYLSLLNTSQVGPLSYAKGDVASGSKSVSRGFVASPRDYADFFGKPGQEGEVMQAPLKPIKTFEEAKPHQVPSKYGWIFPRFLLFCGILSVGIIPIFLEYRKDHLA